MPDLPPHPPTPLPPTGIVEACVRSPVKVAVGVILVGLFGFVAASRMPMQLTPEVQTPTITIETRWLGASPQEIEREIVLEQEEHLKGVEGVRKMTSESLDSIGRVTLEFAVGTDMPTALLKVNARLQQVPQYPTTADQPVLQTANSGDRPIAWFILRPRLPSNEEVRSFVQSHPGTETALAPVLASRHAGQRQHRLRDAIQRHPEAAVLLGETQDVSAMRRFVEDVIEARFERVAGVSNANVVGGREEEMQVIVDPQRLAARGLTIEDLRLALRERNQDTSGGDFWQGKRRYVVRTLGRFQDPEDVLAAPVAWRDGHRIYVRDVADVRPGFKKPDGVVQNFGTSVIAINTQRETGANVLEVMAGLREANEELNAGVLRERGLQLDQVYDETDYIVSAVGLVQQNILLGGTLTILVLLLFLRSVRSTLVIALAIPTSIVGTFLLLDLMGRSLNVISLAGLAFAVGMLVDNAVVVLENVFRHHQEGASRYQAAVRGTKEVWGAVVASTLTTLAVFVPVVFVQEEAGQLFRDIALAISCSVGLSLLVSTTVIPAATARVLPREAGPGTGPPRVLRWILTPFDLLGRGFVEGVAGAHRFLSGGLLRQFALVVVLVGAAALLVRGLFPKVEYLPSGNRNLVFGIVLPPPGYNLDELTEMGSRIEERLRPYWDVDVDAPEARALRYPALDHFFFVARGRQVFLGLRAHDPLRAGELIGLVQEAAGGLPGTFVVAKQASLFEHGLTAGRTIDVEITGPDLAHLVALGGRVMGQVRAVVPGAQPIPRPSLDLSSPEVHVIPRWESATELGLTARGLGLTVDSLVDGTFAGDYFVGGTRIDLTILGQPRHAGSTHALEQLPVATPTGHLVPLSSAASVVSSSGPEQINHSERQRAITIQVSPPTTMALEDAIERIRSQIVAPLEADPAAKMGQGYRVTLSGTADKLEATWEALRFNLLLAVLITYLLLAALFESWLYPFVIILSVPMGAAGGFLGLWVLNRFVAQPLDILTMLGFVILVGTVVNNAILIVHQALVHLREHDMAPREAVALAVRTRLRPIFMTVTTTVFGLLPLVLHPGAGSELYRGLGSVLIGGLLVSTVFTIFLVPTLFRITLAAKSSLVRVIARGDGAPA